MPLIQLARSVSRHTGEPSSRLSLKGRTAFKIEPNPKFDTPPPKALVASTRPNAAVPSVPMAVIAPTVAAIVSGSPIIVSPLRFGAGTQLLRLIEGTKGQTSPGPPPVGRARHIRRGRCAQLL